MNDSARSFQGVGLYGIVGTASLRTFTKLAQGSSASAASVGGYGTGTAVSGFGGGGFSGGGFGGGDR